MIVCESYLYNWHIHVVFLLHKDLWDRVVRSQSPPLAAELCFVCTPTTRMRILLNSHCLNTQNEVLINHSIDSSDTCRHRTSSCENVRGCFYSFWARSHLGHELLQQKINEKINQRTKQEAHGSVVLEKKKIIISSMYFCYFVIITPWKRAGTFIWTNLNSLHPRMLCAKFGWNWLSGSGEEKIYTQ